MRTKIFAVGAMTVLVAAAAVFGGPAFADPSGAPTYRQMVGTGSDTTQDVMNGLAEVVTIGGEKVLGSYDATGSSPIKTRADDCEFRRPNGSGQGIAALRNVLGDSGTEQDLRECVDFARSSRGVADDGTDYTFIPFGIDAVTYAVTPDSIIPIDLSMEEVQAIYRCEPGWTEIEGVPITPLLVQSGSGTRQFWLQAMGLNEDQVAASPCIEQRDDTVQEHDGRALQDFPGQPRAGQILPYSGAQWVAQAFGTVFDRRGVAQLGAINGVPPVMLNPGFEVSRDVYNVVPTAKLTGGADADADIISVFEGPSSLICQATDVIARFGFGLLGSDCGDVSLKGDN